MFERPIVIGQRLRWRYADSNEPSEEAEVVNVRTDLEEGCSPEVMDYVALGSKQNTCKTHRRQNPLRFCSVRTSCPTSRAKRSPSNSSSPERAGRQYPISGSLIARCGQSRSARSVGPDKRFTRGTHR